MKSKVKDNSNLKILGSKEILEQLKLKVESGEIEVLYEEIDRSHIGNDALYGLKFLDYEVNLDDSSEVRKKKKNDKENKKRTVNPKKGSKRTVLLDKKQGKTHAIAMGKFDGRGSQQRLSESSHKTISLEESLKHSKPSKTKDKVVCKECGKVCVKNKFFAHYKMHI